jgi:uncharacterized RDD family membrane protein YckC
MICLECGYDNPPEGTKDGHCDNCGHPGFPVLRQLEAAGVDRPEEASPRIRRASLSDRLTAQILDGFIAILLIIVSAVIGAFLNTVAAESDQILVGIGYLFAIVYLLFADGLKGGQSYGKRLVGIAVIDAKSHQPCRLLQSLVRNILLPFIGVFDWIFIFFGENRRLGDMLAQTIVVKKRYESQR